MINPATLAFLVAASFLGGYFTHKKLIIMTVEKVLPKKLDAAFPDPTPEEEAMLEKIATTIRESMTAR